MVLCEAQDVFMACCLVMHGMSSWCDAKVVFMAWCSVKHRNSSPYHPHAKL